MLFQVKDGGRVITRAGKKCLLRLQQAGMAGKCDSYFSYLFARLSLAYHPYIAHCAFYKDQA